MIGKGGGGGLLDSLRKGVPMFGRGNVVKEAVCFALSARVDEQKLIF